LFDLRHVISKQLLNAVLLNLFDTVQTQLRAAPVNSKAMTKIY